VIEDDERIWEGICYWEEEGGEEGGGRRRGSFERRCLLITDDADLVEISSVFNRFL